MITVRICRARILFCTRATVVNTRKGYKTTYFVHRKACQDRFTTVQSSIRVSRGRDVSIKPSTSLLLKASDLPKRIFSVSLEPRRFCSALAWKEANMPEKKPFSRLPENVVPSNYALRLTPNLKAFTFEGNEEITLEVKSATKSLVLNSAEIKVKNVKYSGTGQAFDGEGIAVTYSEEDETVTFKFPEDLKIGTGSLYLDFAGEIRNDMKSIYRSEQLPEKPGAQLSYAMVSMFAVGSGTLSVNFTGELNDKMKGFYRSKYSSPEGEERYGAVTQFEATDARRAFPCWDEPAVKATFDVTLVVPEDRVALSNMPVKVEGPCENVSGYKEVKYERTPIMSTYLLAFVVGHYDFVEATDSDGVKVRVYTPVGKKEQGQFALEVAVKTLPFYKNYFNIAYPLPKMDLIAIADFAAGAMENWGLVTYRETALLVDPENSSSHAKQWVALVVGHELAHQWFGNLVTMEWWTHLWLNEGFASWIEYLCVDHCFPEYDIWTQFASTDFTRALELDALKNSHPIEVPVGHPNEVDEIFDLISYSKGASVIRMLHDFLGDDDFRKGMNAYLTKHKYNNTLTEDLWNALGQASGKPVEEIMNTWTKQMGFPVLKVSQTQEGTTRILKIRQQKFCADGKQSSSDSLWQVPVSVSTASSPGKAVHKFVLKTQETTVTIEDVKPGDWIKLNTGAVGFYRTYYSPDMLSAILPGIRDGSLPPRDRLGLQNDLFALARAGEASTVEFLKVAEAFVNETSYTVWSDLNTNLSLLSGLLQYSDFHDNFKAFLCKLFSNVAKKLGWEVKEGESHLDAMLRGLVIGQLGTSGDKAVCEEAKKRFEDHCNGVSALPADLRAPVYRTALVQGGEKTMDALLKLYRESDLQEEKVRILRSLGIVKDTEQISRVLKFAIGEEVRTQDTIFCISGVTCSVAGRELAWQFVQDNWAMLHERYHGMFLISRLIKSTTDHFVTEQRANEVEEFFKANPAPAAERTIKQSIENIHLNCNQLSRDTENMKEFLATYV